VILKHYLRDEKGRTSFAKGTCPEGTEGGQAHVRSSPKSGVRMKKGPKDYLKNRVKTDFPRYTRDKLTIGFTFNRQPESKKDLIEVLF